jgi:hypothetical protein
MGGGNYLVAANVVPKITDMVQERNHLKLFQVHVNMVQANIRGHTISFPTLAVELIDHSKAYH